MKIWDMLRGGALRETRAADPSWDALTGGAGAATASGMHVDAKSAESLSAVYGCVQSLSESVSCLPLHVFRRTDTGDRERADGHWLSRLLERPNDWQTGPEFREEATACVLLRGNSYSRKDINGAGEVVSLVPLHPDRVTVVKLPSGKLRYDYSEERGNATRLLQDEVMHLRDRTEPGNPVARSRIAIARETLGLALAQRKHGANTFSRGRPSAVLLNEGKRDFTTEELKTITDRLDYFASAGAGKAMNLPRGMKWQNIGISNEDLEFMAAMQFSVEEVCRIFRIPPTMVGDLRHGNYSNTLELGQQFVRYSLQPWLTRWEEGISRSLLGSIARGRYYAEHAVDALLRAQSKERSEFYRTMIDAGVMDAGECRKLENLPQRDVDATNAS